MGLIFPLSDWDSDRRFGGTKAAVNGLFPRILGSIGRTDFISSDFEKIMDDLHLTFRPYSHKLNDLRESLLFAYTNFEACLSDQGSIQNFSQNTLDAVHNTFKFMFRAMKEDLTTKGKDVSLIRLHAVKVAKRKLSGSDDVRCKRPRYVPVPHHLSFGWMTLIHN